MNFYGVASSAAARAKSVNTLSTSLPLPPKTLYKAGGKAVEGAREVSSLPSSLIYYYYYFARRNPEKVGGLLPHGLTTTTCTVSCQSRETQQHEEGAGGYRTASLAFHHSRCGLAPNLLSSTAGRLRTSDRVPVICGTHTCASTVSIKFRWLSLKVAVLRPPSCE